MGAERTLKICPQGHKYYKSSDCPTCPICEAGKKTREGFLSLLSAPACRALENHGINTIEELSGYSEKEILRLHGLGQSSIPILRTALEIKGLSFRK